LSNFPSITAPAQNIESLHNTVLELKNAIELLTGQQGTDNANAALLRGDMTELALRNLPLSTASVVQYERGLWQPVLTTTGTNFTSVTYDVRTRGDYIRVGNLVYIRGSLVTDAVTVGSASGTVGVGGLPFNSIANAADGGESYGAITVGYAATWTGEEPISALVVPDSKFIQLYRRAAVDGDALGTEVADVATGANTNALHFAGFYICA
jgi:hypothetical protein